MPPNTSRLSEHLFVYHGPTNVGIIRDSGKALLIDCGDGRVTRVLPRLGISKVSETWFTHHHRDIACGAASFAAMGSLIRVPQKEKAYFASVAGYWQNPQSRWHLYNQHPHHLMLAEPVRIDSTLADVQVVRWGKAVITVISTPGHTDGSVSYLVEVDGIRVVFSGDAIYGPGQVWNLWSLQKGAPPAMPGLTDYHGYLGAKDQLELSLTKLLTFHPDKLVPDHGVIMENPAAAIHQLLQRLDSLYDQYVQVSALRYYFPQLFTAFKNKPGQVPASTVKPAPGCLRHFATSWVLISKDKAALVMDCQNEEAVKTLQGMVAKGDIKKIEALWVTHYHDDHIDGIPAFQKSFPGVPVIADEHVAQIITGPLAWRLPCISPEKIYVDRCTRNGQKWQWHEFMLTSYYFPGQTLYHGGLLAEGEGLRMFFAGDSFTPTGIDDYCMYNRNWLGEGAGFDRCLRLLHALKLTDIFNCHVTGSFLFSDEQYRFMQKNLQVRTRWLKALLPWDNPNYGTDESWARCYPYEQKAKAGMVVPVSVVLTNHSSYPVMASCRLHLPGSWSNGPNNGWVRKKIASKKEVPIRLSIKVPAGVLPGRYVIPVDISYGQWQLPQFTEAIIEVTAS